MRSKKHISYLVLVFLLLTLNMQLLVGKQILAEAYSGPGILLKWDFYKKKFNKFKPLSIFANTFTICDV